MYHIKQTPLGNALGVIVAPIAHRAGSARKEGDFGWIMLKLHLLSSQKKLLKKSPSLVSAELGCSSANILNYLFVHYLVSL